MKKKPTPKKQPSSEGRPRYVFSMRLAADERALLETAAAKYKPEWMAAPLSLGRFMKSIAMAKARELLGGSPKRRR